MFLKKKQKKRNETKRHQTAPKYHFKCNEALMSLKNN